MTRAIILMLDSFGIGATEDAERFGDVGADTLGHIARHRRDVTRRPLEIPNLARLGLLHAAQMSTGEYPAGCDTAVEVTGTYGYAKELSSGKDTPSGHWEMAGLLLDRAFPVFPEGFPPEMVRARFELYEVRRI